VHISTPRHSYRDRGDSGFVGKRNFFHLQLLNIQPRSNGSIQVYRGRWPCSNGRYHRGYSKPDPRKEVEKSLGRRRRARPRAKAWAQRFIPPSPLCSSPLLTVVQRSPAQVRHLQFPTRDENKSDRLNGIYIGVYFSVFTHVQFADQVS